MKKSKRRFSSKIKKGDEVVVLLGKDRGKTGKVERIVGKEGKVYVGGVNLVKRHVKKQGQMEGGIIDIIKPVDISNISLICPKCKKPTRIGFQLKDGIKSRICKKCGKEI